MLAYSNKLKFSLAAMLLGSLISCSDIIENKNFNQISKDFLNGYFQNFPVQATLMGNSNYNHQLDNFSQDNVNRAIQFFKLTSQRISLIDTSKLSNHNKTNFQILASQLKLQLFELEQRKRWQNDASFYTQKIYNAVHGLKICCNETTENRAGDLIARLEQVPNLLIDATKNLQASNIVNLSPAIDQIDNLKKMIAFQLFSHFMVPDKLIDSLNRKSEIVVDSLDSFKKFLESKSKTASDQCLTMTPELYQTYLSLLGNKKMNLNEIANLIEADYQKYYKEIFEAAQIILGKSKKANEAPIVINVVEAANEEVKKQSLNKDEVIPFCFEAINNVKRFVDEIMNLSLLVDYKIQINWEDDNQVPGLKFAKFEDPGLLSPVLQFHCYLKPILNDQDWLEQLSQLRDFNKPALKVMLMLEAIPIHYHYWSNKIEDLPVLARAFPDQIFLTAWNYYFAFTLLNAGFKGYDAELKYMLLRDYLRNLALAKVEIQYYLQQLSSQQLERVLLESKLFQKNEIAAAVRQINCSPGQALVIFWGFKQLEDLEYSCRANAGPLFSFNDFLPDILAEGPVAIEQIKRTVVKRFTLKNDN